jgi:hypothetical protein
MQISPLGGCLVSALSIPIGENGTIPQLTLTLITITSMQLHTSKLFQTTLRPHHQTTLKHNYCIHNVLVSIPICKIINKKEWHWPPNIYLLMPLESRARICKLWLRTGIFKLLRSSGIDSASLCNLASRYDSLILTRFLAPIDCSKIPAQSLKVL